MSGSFEKEKEKGVNGIMNMQSRAKKLQGQLQIESTKAEGTSIRFVLRVALPING